MEIKHLLDKIHYCSDSEFEFLKEQLNKEITEEVTYQVKTSVNEIEMCIQIVGWMLQAPGYSTMKTDKKVKIAKEIYLSLLSELKNPS